MKDAIEKLDAGNAHLRSDLRAARERLVKLHHERAAVDDRIPSRVAAHALLLAAKGAETERQALLAGWLGGAGSEASRALKELGEWYALFVTDEGETGAFAASRAVETLALAAALDPANADAAELLEAVEPGADLAALKAGLDMPLTLPAGLRPEEAESVAEQLLARSRRGLHIAERTGLSDSQVALHSGIAYQRCAGHHQGLDRFLRPPAAERQGLSRPELADVGGPTCPLPPAEISPAP